MKRPRRQWCEVWYRILNGYWCDHLLFWHPEKATSAFTEWEKFEDWFEWRLCTECRRWETK